MSIYIDVKYLNLLSNRLLLYKQKREYLWNFRCPICGDSQKKTTKARGYIHRKENDLFYKITGGQVLKIIPDTESTSLIIQIETFSDGDLLITLPKTV